ncbi:MAG: hypothetical protein WDN45_00150 [Caulobacteraceae bacterium]
MHLLFALLGRLVGRQGLEAFLQPLAVVADVFLVGQLAVVVAVDAGELGGAALAYSSLVTLPSWSRSCSWMKVSRSWDAAWAAVEAPAPARR